MCTGYHKQDYTESPQRKSELKCKTGFNSRQKDVNPQEWWIVKTRIAIDQIRTPTFRFYVKDPSLYAEGRKLVVTMRQNERAVRNARPGQALYVYDRPHPYRFMSRYEVQIEVLPAGDSRSEHPVPPIKLGLEDRLRSSIMHAGRIEIAASEEAFGFVERLLRVSRVRRRVGLGNPQSCSLVSLLLDFSQSFRYDFFLRLISIHYALETVRLI